MPNFTPESTAVSPVGRGAQLPVRLERGIQAVFFDVDGVLLDSLPQHLKICRDLAAAYGLDIRIPAPLAFRRMIAEGVKISPMRNFFEAVGFDGAYLEAAIETYEASFAQHAAIAA